MSPFFQPKMKLTLFFIISSFVITSAQLTYIHQNCYESFVTYSVLSGYRTHIRNATTELATKASTSYFGNSTAGFRQEKANALFSCRYDITPEVCQSCVASTANNISWCFSSVEGLIAYEECTLHYSNRSISGAMEELPQLYVYSTGKEDAQFSQLLEKTVTDLITQVTSQFLISSRYFATTTAKYSSSETIYVLAQCNPDITSSECRTCLRSGFDGFNANHTGSNYGQIFLTTCRLSYILSRVVPKEPWMFAQTFAQLKGPRSPPLPPSPYNPPYSPRYNYSPSTDTGKKGMKYLLFLVLIIGVAFVMLLKCCLNACLRKWYCYLKGDQSQENKGKPNVESESSQVPVHDNHHGTIESQPMLKV